MRYAAWIAVAIGMILGGAARADIAAARFTFSNGCTQYAMCVAEDAVGPCKNPTNTDVIVADLQGRSVVTVFATQTTATTFACDVYGDDYGYLPAPNASALTSAGSGTQLSSSNRMVSLSGTLRHVWVECPTITNNTVTINLIACSR